jgi:hypothetical protein
MPLPATASRTVNDFIPGVTDALQQRTDAALIAPRYIRKAVIEITESYPFEELRTTGPTVVLTAGTAIYPVSVFLNPGDDYTMIDSFAVYVDYPNNTVVSTLDYKTPKAIETMIASATKGLPSRWTRYGRNIHLGPTPYQTYSVFCRYQIRHPFPPDEAALGGAPVYVPDSWQDIVEYAAAQRIAVVKRWNDQAKYLHDILYGDPEYIQSEGKRGRPGLIAARLFQPERDEQRSTRQLMPLVQRYTVRC